MNASDQTLASAAAAYFEARDAARKEDKRRRQREKGDDFTFNGQPVFSIAHMETMRPSEPMTPDELKDTIQILTRGNDLLAAEWPAKIAAFEEALQRARKHFAARDEARRAAGIPAADDDDQARWLAVEELEIAAWGAPVSTLGDVAGFLRLLQDHFALMGNVDDFIIESRLTARLGDAIKLLSHAQQ